MGARSISPSWRSWIFGPWIIRDGRSRNVGFSYEAARFFRARPTRPDVHAQTDGAAGRWCNGGAGPGRDQELGEQQRHSRSRSRATTRPTHAPTHTHTFFAFFLHLLLSQNSKIIDFFLQQLFYKIQLKNSEFRNDYITFNSLKNDFYSTNRELIVFIILRNVVKWDSTGLIFFITDSGLYLSTYPQF